MTTAVSKRRPQPPGYIAETDQIKENKKKHAGTVHKFTPAKWTHPNGHPRCLLCGDEQPISPECGRDATPEEEEAAMEKIRMSLSKVSKGIVTWDGDGVQGAGQPRDRRGRWVALPGPTDIKRVGAFDLDDGTIGVFKDNDRRPIKTYKTERGANKAVSDLIKTDRDAYVEAEAERKRANRNLRRKVARDQKKAEEGQKAAQQEEEVRRKGQEAIFGPPKKKGRKPKGVKQGGEKPRISRRVEVSEVERLPNPGRPTPAQVKDAKDWIKRELPDNEAKYAGLIIRLLQNRGTTQDPTIRGDMSRRYDIPAGRLIQIEQDTYAAMFPQGAPAQRRVPNLRGQGGGISPKQEESMQRLGARKGIPQSDPKTVHRPERYFKIQKGPKRGRWAKVSWGGDIELVTKREAEREAVKSKIWWSGYLLRTKATAKKLRDARKRDIDVYNNSDLSRRKMKQFKIVRAMEWAERENLDPYDSYWWAFYWNDASLLSDAGEKYVAEQGLDPRMNQQMNTETPISVSLTDILEREHMDPALLEGILSLPDIDSRDMRGHRPGSKKAQPGDEDFEEASALSRVNDPEWEAKNRDREISHQRRIKAAYDRFKKKNPTSRMTLEQFTNKYYNERMRIPGGVKKGNHPRWDGDGVQAPGQPRNRKGEWSRGGALSAVGGHLVEAGARQHHGSRASRAGAGKAAAFDHRKKMVTLPIKKPQKGSTHQQMVGGVPVRRGKKVYTPEEAYYLRNNGPTKITNARLKEIYEDRKKMTVREHDLISAAAGDVRFDGEDGPTFRAVNAGGARRKGRRYEMFKNLRTNMSGDFAKEHGLAEKGKGGQVLLHGSKDKRAQAQRKKDNVKRAKNRRNVYDNINKRQELLDDFGDGKKAKCIFCGRPVYLEDVSPERIKPGNMKGIYTRGNVAPAHKQCNKNTSSGVSAQYAPEKYYEMMWNQFLKNYNEWFDEGYMDFVFKKHKKEKP